jgi:hypothetical protein
MPKGFSALILVIIISVASLALVLSSAWLGLGQLSLNEARQGEERARLVAETCAEISLLEVQKDDSYSGGVLSLGDESCIITVSRTGSPWTSVVLRIVSTTGYWHKALVIGAALDGADLIINSWQETTL